jgi:hypothetical protein
MIEFQEKASEIISVLDEIPCHTYLSVLLYRGSTLINKRSNNYNDWENIFFKSTMLKDCLISHLAKHFAKMNEDNEDTIFWDSVVNIDNPVHQKRIEHNLNNGITLVKKYTHRYSFCISACSEKTTNKYTFHHNFMSKHTKIHRILRGNNV